MFFKRIKPREFDYTPRFYDPEKDPEEKIRQKLGFNRKRRLKRKERSPLYWLILLIIVFYIYLKLSGLI